MADLTILLMGGISAEILRDAGIDESMSDNGANLLDRAGQHHDAIPGHHVRVTAPDDADITALRIDHAVVSDLLEATRRDRDAAEAACDRLAANAAGREAMLTSRTDALRAAERERDETREAIDAVAEQLGGHTRGASLDFCRLLVDEARLVVRNLTSERDKARADYAVAELAFDVVLNGVPS